MNKIVFGITCQHESTGLCKLYKCKSVLNTTTHCEYCYYNKDSHTQQLPSDDDDTHLANIFCDYFAQKIDNIRNNFTLTTETEETLPQDIKFDQFRPVSIDEIRKVITSYNSKSCELDPIPT